MTKIYVMALGCRLNQSEMLVLGRRLAAAGCLLVDKPEEADVVVLNTCAVTQEAVRKSRQALRRLRNENPGACVVATGCYAELDESLGGVAVSVDVVLGNEEKQALLARPGDFLPINGASAAGRHTGRERTRALVRIQEGCDNRCTYCIVWQLRGPQRSREPDEVVAEVQQMVADGYKEIVLTGVHIGAYGRDQQGRQSLALSGLVARLLTETNLLRLRLSSIEPWDFRSIDLSLWQDLRLCRHLHVPLQSGCDAVLRRMGRRYTVQEYALLLDHIRSCVEDVAITTDVIVGFPGETEAEFEQSLQFVQQCCFARVHVFPYSPRPGTRAVAMPDQVALDVRQERARRMRMLASQSAREYEEHFVGRSLAVLWECKRGQWWSGLTSNYLRLHCRCDADLQNHLTCARIEGFDRDGLIASIVEN